MSGIVILLVVATITNIGLASVQWYKENILAKAEHRKSNHSILIISIISSLVALGAGVWQDHKQNQSDEQTEIYRLKFEKSQETSIKLSQQIIDSTGKTLQGYIKLDKANSTIIDLQNSTLDELTGGDNKPILLCTYSIGYDIDNKRTNYLNFSLHNPGKSNLKNVQLIIRDGYKAFKTIERSNEFGDVSGRGETENIYLNYSSEGLLMDIYNLSKDVQKIDVSNLDKGKTKTVYSTSVPNNGNIYHFVANVEWSHGSYTAKFSLKETDSGYYSRRSEIYDSQLKVKNLTKYFKLPKLKTPKALVYCGNIKYEDDEYKIYWNSKELNIVSICESSIYANTYKIFKPKSPNEALSIALPTMIKIYGKEFNTKSKGVNPVTGVLTE